MDSFYWSDEQHYYVDLFPSPLNHNSLDIYSQADGLVGVFNQNGDLEGEFLKYPVEPKETDYHITPYQIFAQNSNLNYSLKILFPACGHI